MISRLSDHYVDTSNYKQYSRIVGGLAWPTSDAEGFLVVAAEDFMLDAVLDARPLYLLVEAKAKNLSELGRLYGEMSGTFFAGPWYGKLNNFYCHEMSEAVPGFSLVPAPHSEDPESAFHYAGLIKTLLDPQKKVLSLGAKNRLIRGFFNNIHPRDLQGRAETKPPLAAIGYAVSQLCYFKSKKVKTVGQEMAGVNFGDRW